MLESAYGYPAQRVAAALERILHTRQLRVEDYQDAWVALREYRDGADFVDSFLAAVNLRLGCECTVTFDRRAAKRSGFALL